MTDDETKAARDAMIFGTGMMLDGKHVPMEDVMTDDLIAHIWDMAHRLDNEKDRHAIIALSDLVPVLENRIEAQDKRNKELEAALRVAAGYISTKEGHTDQHPQDVYDWIFRTALGEKKDD
jgi:hypothetical protein